MRMPSFRITICHAALLLSACASSPKESFYTLNPVAPTTLAQGQQTAAAYSVAIGPVHVPELVDRPQLVIRKGSNELEVLEQHRWAQPLRAEIAQAVSSALASQLPQARIAFDRDVAGQNADYRIAIDVKRFEAVPGQAVTVQAIWTIRTARTDASKTPIVAQSTIREPLNTGSYDELATGFAQAIKQVSGEIAQAISSTQATSNGK